MGATTTEPDVGEGRLAGMQPPALRADRPESHDSRQLIPWGVPDAVAVLATWLVSQLVIGLAISLVGVRVGDPFTAAMLLSVTPLVLILLTVGWVAAVASRSGGSHRLFGRRRATWRDVLAGLNYGIAGSVVITFVVGGGLQLLFRYLGVEVPPVQEQLRELATGPSAPVAAIAIVGLAPIGEELFFRGMLFQSLQKPLRFWPAATISGIVFGLIHFEPLVTVVTAILGVYLAWIFQRRGTLLVPIIAHSIFNLLGLVLIRLGLG